MQLYRGKRSDKCAVQAAGRATREIRGMKGLSGGPLRCKVCGTPTRVRVMFSLQVGAPNFDQRIACHKLSCLVLLDSMSALWCSHSSRL